MTTRGTALESLSSVESGISEPSSVGVDLTAMRQFMQSDRAGNNTASQHLNSMEIVDELAKKPVCEDSVCDGNSRHVDVYSTANFAEDQFDLLDKNDDSFIKADEITAYQERFKGTITPRMQEHLDALRSGYDSTMALANDEWGTENDGITRDDLDVLEDREDGARISEHIKEFATKHFDAADTNGNGFITADEIKAFEAKNKFNLEHPVSDRDALEVIGHLSEGRNMARATGDFLGMTTYNDTGRGLTRGQVSQAADMVKNGVESFTNPFFFFNKD